MSTMEATKLCDFLTSLVKSSRLNYLLKNSPFSVILSIEKSFIRVNNEVEVVPGEIFNLIDNSVHEMRDS